MYMYMYVHCSNLSRYCSYQINYIVIDFTMVIFESTNALLYHVIASRRERWIAISSTISR